MKIEITKNQLNSLISCCCDGKFIIDNIGCTKDNFDESVKFLKGVYKDD